MATIFDRTLNLIGEGNLVRLKASKVLVFGVGGVGSYTVEALTRSGIGEIDIVDKDVVDITNINRQLIALHSTVGLNKVDVMKERMLDINPDVKVSAIKCFYTPNNEAMIDFSRYDYVIDCIDNVTAKIDIIMRAKCAGVKVISSMGTGNKLHPELFEITDIEKTSVCPLARVMRKELKERGIKNVKVLYSREEPLKTGERTPMSISFVPSVAGLMIAGEVIRELMEEK